MTLLKEFRKVFYDKSLTVKASLNALASALDYGARVVVGLLITPVLVHGLGSSVYGVWLVLGPLISYITPASGRPTQTLRWTIANKQASTDYAEKRRDIGSALFVWLLFLPLLTLAGGVLAWYAPVWLKVSAALAPSVRLAAGLLVMNLIIVSLVEVPRAVLQGENLSYKRMGLSAVLVFLSGGLTALAVYLGTGLIGIAVAHLASSLLTGLLFLRVVRRYVPWFGFSAPSFGSVRRFAGLSVWFIAWNLVMTLMKASDVVLLGIFASVGLVTTYSLTKYLPQAITDLVAVMVTGITPGMGGILGSGNVQKAARVRAELMSLTWLITTAAGSTILLWNPSFVQLWVGTQYDAGQIPTLLIVLMVQQFVLIRNDANIIDLTLDLRRKVLTGVLSVTLSLAIAGILVSYFEMGIVGLCLGFIAGRVILSLAYPWLVGRFLEIPLSSQLMGVLRPGLVTIMLWGSASSLSLVLKANTWLVLVASVGMTLVVMSLLAFYGGLSQCRRKNLLQRLLRVAQLPVVRERFVLKMR
ncbi:MAG: lipopolysaccharide biosynthesis protein [Gammaproteobacteria bacterium]